MITRRSLLQGVLAGSVLTLMPQLWLPRKSQAQPVALAKAFIGAEGFGAQAKGWRVPTAKILFVTNLNNSGPGSFRQAYSVETGPRYILFQVGGYLPHFGFQYLTNAQAGGGSVYVAGQTAPGDGITLKGQSNSAGQYDGLYVQNAQVCIRHLRVRCHSGSDNTWAFGLWGASQTILDHCSGSWATDDQVMVQTTLGMITVQHCLLSEPKGYGLTMNDGHGPCSAHHNFIGHAHQRNPLANPGQASEFSNNLLYNWGGAAGKASEILNYYGLTPPPTYDFLGNVYRWGPNSGWENAAGWDQPVNGREIRLSKGPMTFYHNNSNRAWLPTGHIPARILNEAGNTVTFSASKLAAPVVPVSLQDVSTQALTEAWAAALLANAGCTRPKRDAYDAFQVTQFQQFKGWKVPPYGSEAISPFTLANGGNPWPALISGAPRHLQPSGLTDEFITRMGLANTAASALSTSISQSRGLGEDYQNLEWCLMEVAGDIVPLNGGVIPPPPPPPPPPPVDTDGDGFPDSTDACPTVPGTDHGCPVVPDPPPVSKFGITEQAERRIIIKGTAADCPGGITNTSTQIKDAAGKMISKTVTVICKP